MNEYEAWFRQHYMQGPDGDWEVPEYFKLPAWSSTDGGGRFKGPEWRAYMDAGSRAHAARLQGWKRWAWAIPNDEAIAAIAELSPIVEVAAGTGYWAHLLRQAGAVVQAFDVRTVGRWAPGSLWGTLPRAHYPVARGTVARAMKMYPRHTPLVIWPGYDDSVGADTVRLTQADRLVYIGETGGGCTGSPEMHHLLGDGDGLWWTKTNDDDPDPPWAAEDALFKETRRIDIPSWPNVRDALYIFERY